VCLDGTAYVNPTLRTTSSDAGQYVWLECASFGGENEGGCYDSNYNWVGPAPT